MVLSVSDPLGAGMLSTVRVARGLTQSALAKVTGISQATLSKMESGLMTLDGGRLATLADKLDAPPELLTQPGDFAGTLAIVFHRKRASLPVSAASQLRARLDLVHLQINGLVGDSVPVRLARSPLTDGGYTTPEEIAGHVRTTLGLPAGPIEDLIAALEAAGVVFVRSDLGSVKVDALMSWPPGGRPVVLLADHAPGDRQRFSVAHELGHAVMHEVPAENQEQEADRFASELLLPRTQVASRLRDVSLPQLARLKQEWGVSMAAILRRARDLGQISDFQYRRGSIELSQSGYRTREPVEVPPEQPRLLMRRVGERLARGETVAELARLAWMTEKDFRNTYLSGVVA